MQIRAALFVIMLSAAGAPRLDAATPAPDGGVFDAVLEWSGERGSSAVVIARGGKIVAARRWDRPASRVATAADGWPIEDVASVQKSITAVLVAVAVERRLLRVDDPVTRWLGPGWSRAGAEAESEITVRHLLTMTSGLKEDLTFEAGPGTHWRYNAPAYCRLLTVLTASSGLELEVLTGRWLTGPLGMEHSGWGRRTGPSAAVNPWGFLTSAHDLVRFGQVILDGGRPVLRDRAFFDQMLRPSQGLNRDYGYLWWLNSEGKPGRPGRRIPQAPADLVAAEGAGDRKLYVVPARDLVVVRLGEPAGKGFAERFWELLAPGLNFPGNE